MQALGLHPDILRLQIVEPENHKMKSEDHASLCDPRQDSNAGASACTPTSCGCKIVGGLKPKMKKAKTMRLRFGDRQDSNAGAGLHPDILRLQDRRRLKPIK